jgi:hypothetical protein
MREAIEEGHDTAAPDVSRIPHAVWINRPRTQGANASSLARGAAATLVTVGLFTVAIASPSGIAPAPQELAGTDAELQFAVTPAETVTSVPAICRTTSANLPAQVAPDALRSPEEQSSTSF